MARNARAAPPPNLLSAPIELAGDWGGSPPDAAMRVIERMRQACLDGVRLLSDRQPRRLRVDDHTSGPPAIWLHREPAQTAWIIVDIGPRDWCKLAYQFGHELGHVLCNSWQREAAPRPPTQWLEEAMVEAFSIRGLGRLADSWQRDPPFVDDAAFASAIRQYRKNLLVMYESAPRPYLDAISWFHAYRDARQGLGDWEGPAVIGVLALLESDPGCAEDLAAVNRWPQRSGIPIEEYLQRWETSCDQIGASGRLPKRVRRLFGLA